MTPADAPNARSAVRFLPNVSAGSNPAAIGRFSIFSKFPCWRGLSIINQIIPYTNLLGSDCLKTDKFQSFGAIQDEISLLKTNGQRAGYPSTSFCLRDSQSPREILLEF